MSAPEAFAVHRTARRVRWRVPAMRGDAAYFERVERELGSAPGVKEVCCEPATASVLVLHETEVAEIAARAEAQELFIWAAEPTRDALRELTERLRAAEADLHARTHGRWGLESVAFYAFVGAGLWQMAHGSILPAGIPLLTKAIEIATEHGGRGSGDRR